MPQDKLVIVVGGSRVRSDVNLDEAASMYRLTSSCDGHSQTQTISVLPRPGYTAEQLEYEVEVFRHKMAEEAAGHAQVKKLLADGLQRVGDAAPDIPEIPLGPRFQKPKAAK